MTITNFGSGEVEISDDQGRRTRLDRESANRLVMAGRMHTVAEFVEKLPALIASAEIAAALRETFEKASTSTDKWNVKEKFARLRTLAKGYEPANPGDVVETVSF
ncbi:MAG TPA: hypothetical protein VLJ37_11790 [bacterium]|nr:hypothetical protein [bacterium]